MLRLRTPLARRLAYVAIAVSAVHAPRATAQSPTAGDVAASAQLSNEPKVLLAAAISRVIESAVPPVYEKHEDWGATKEVVVGARLRGKPFHLHLDRRTKAVNHGVWKHYRLRVGDPAQTLAVSVSNLHTRPDGRLACTLALDARIDAWARAKVYEYGVHLIALEVEGDAAMRAVVEVDLGWGWDADGGRLRLILDPRVSNAHAVIEDLNVRRVSNAKGPLVRQLSDGVRRVLEDELASDKVTAKLNRAIDKKRSRLSVSPAELMDRAWRPLLNFVEPADDAVAAQAPSPGRPGNLNPSAAVSPE